MAKEDNMDLKTTESKKQWHIKIIIGHPNISARRSCSMNTPVVWSYGENAIRWNPTKSTIWKIGRRTKQKQTKTTLDR